MEGPRLDGEMLEWWELLFTERLLLRLVKVPTWPPFHVDAILLHYLDLSL
jgi:hypothetical protein